MYNFEPYNVLLAIATNILVLLMTASVLQGHKCLTQGSSMFFQGKDPLGDRNMELCVTKKNLCDQTLIGRCGLPGARGPPVEDRWFIGSSVY